MDASSDGDSVEQSQTTQGSDASEAEESVPPLRITVGSRSEAYAPIWVALGEDLFTKHGVEVEVASFSGIQTGLGELLSDQIDIFLFTPFLGLQSRQDDQDIVVVYNHSNLGYQATTFLAAPGIDSFEQLAAMGSDCKIATTSIGTAPYYFATRYVEVFDLGCEIVPQASIDLQVPALVSGEVDAASVVNAVGFAAEAEGLATVLYDPRTVSDEIGTELLPEAYPLLISMGKRDVLAGKQESVSRYVAALMEAADLIEDSTPEELAEITLRVEPWVGVESESLVTGWMLTQPQTPSGEAARIDEADWDRLLTGVTDWGIESIDPTDPALAYEEAVDMSYFDTALGRR